MVRPAVVFVDDSLYQYLITKTMAALFDVPPESLYLSILLRSVWFCMPWLNVMSVSYRFKAFTQKFSSVI
jgi:hypothetical protein